MEKGDLSNRILQDIIQGEYKETPALSERGLMEKYGAGKSPIREAMLKLCSDNVLRSIPRYGYEIIPLTERDIRNILQFRLMVEGECLPLILANANDVDFKALAAEAAVSPLNEQTANVFDDWDKNSHFHLGLVALCANRYCYEQIQRSLQILKRAYAQFYWDRWHRIHFRFNNDSHAALIAALQNRDLVLARQLLEHDIASFGDIIVSSPV